MAIDQDERDRWYREGQEDVKEGRDSTLNGPWGSIFDKEGEWEEKNDAYEAGRDNQESNESESSGGGCFFTTACVTHAGLSDDCEELTVLRRFRDGFLRNQPGGQALISRYYKEAPLIVARIQASPQADAELAKMLLRIREIVCSIQRGFFAEALLSYSRLFHRLHHKYAS